MGNNLANIEVRLQGPEGDVGVENRVNSTDDDMVGTSPLTTDVESNGGGTRPLDGHEAVRSGVQYPRVIDEILTVIENLRRYFTLLPGVLSLCIL